MCELTSPCFSHSPRGGKDTRHGTCSSDIHQVALKQMPRVGGGEESFLPVLPFWANCPSIGRQDSILVTIAYCSWAGGASGSKEEAVLGGRLFQVTQLRGRRKQGEGPEGGAFGGTWSQGDTWPGWDCTGKLEVGVQGCTGSTDEWSSFSHFRRAENQHRSVAEGGGWTGWTGGEGLRRKCNVSAMFIFWKIKESECGKLLACIESRSGLGYSFTFPGLKTFVKE